MTLSPDDPRITAYALGELDAEESAKVEAELANSPEAKRELEAIREAAQRIEQALADEPLVGLTDEHRRAVEARMDEASCDPSPRPTRRRRSKLTLGTWCGLAACLALVVAIVTPSYKKANLSAKNAARLTEQQEQSQLSSFSHTSTATEGKPPRPRKPHALAPRGGRSVMSAQDRQRLAALGYTGGSSLSYYMSALGYVSADPAPMFNTEAYANVQENVFRSVGQNPLSTFSIDVDTASYANVRRFLTSGRLPPPDAVRIEEMINYFTYDYPQPTDRVPFSVNVDVADCPWNSEHRLARIGLQGYEIPPEERPPSNLVFLLDVSGSMQPANKLPLLKRSMRMLVNQLDGYDRVAIVVYAGASGLVLDSTPCDRKRTVLGALDRLAAGGSTNGGAGIQLAYGIASENFIEGGTNRVILATDGDFNVGITNQGDLIRLIEDRAKTGVFLSVLGFGTGNYKDSTLESLADKGNGNYAYIDTLVEARKVLVEQMGGTLVTIAKDVKIQVEFNPAAASAYRLIGYENRLLAKEDFNDDTKDAGEIGAGHTVTALYEIVPVGVATDVPAVDALKYQEADPQTPVTGSGELMTVKLRYKLPEEDKSTRLEYAVVDEGASIEDTSGDFRFTAAVASFGMLLRDSAFKGDATYESVIALAESGLGADERGQREEFIDLVYSASELELMLDR